VKKGGYVGKLLGVDLSERKISELELPDDGTLRKYIGGWALGMRYLYDLLPEGFFAEDPENPLIFMTGPLTGLPLPGATNTTLATKNFDTGFTVGRSHTHHNFGKYLKGNGYDGVIVTGKSEKPVYLWIHDGKGELRDASHLWGSTDTHEAEDVIQEELGSKRISVASIGPCGENLVAGGMIMNDRNHGFSHSGVGSAMGAKLLKAIAVFGKKPIPVADSEKLSSLKRKWVKGMQSPGHVGWNLVRNQWLRKSEYRSMLKLLGFCGRNLRANQLVEYGLGWAKQKYTKKTCPGCPIACSYDVEITTGPREGYIATLCGGGEALEGGGSILGITEPGSIFYMADLYDRLGIEGSMAGCTLAMAIEAFEKGLITTKDTDGLELKWGDSEVAEALVKKMVYREGFGEVLARGIKEAAEWIGGEAPSFAVHVKGTGISLHDWRATWGVLFGQIVGSGAGWPAPGADCLGIQEDAGYPEYSERFDHHSKPMEAKETGIIKFLNDSTGFCWFITWGFRDLLRNTTETLNAAVGWNLTPGEVREVGERAMHLERAFNVRHGLKPAHDWTVPDRLVEAPAEGPAKGMSIKPHLESMAKEYHRLMGWDEKTGKPLESALRKAGLDDVLGDCWR
jgi:aldehyde:ferredoxin oxidoreductase